MRGGGALHSPTRASGERGTSIAGHAEVQWKRLEWFPRCAEEGADGSADSRMDVTPPRASINALTATAAAEGSPQGAARCTAGSMSSAGSTGSPAPAQSGRRWACALPSRCEPAAGMRWRCWRPWLSARRRGGEGRRAAREVSRAACPPRAATAPAARERGRATQLVRRSVIICCRGLSTRGRSRCGAPRGS